MSGFVVPADIIVLAGRSKLYLSKRSLLAVIKCIVAGKALIAATNGPGEQKRPALHYTDPRIGRSIYQLLLGLRAAAESFYLLYEFRGYCLLFFGLIIAVIEYIGPYFPRALMGRNWPRSWRIPMLNVIKFIDSSLKVQKD